MKRWPTRPLGEVVTCLDSQRIPVKEEDRRKRCGSVPYYGANGQVGWIDKALFDEPLLLIAEDGGHFDEPGKGVAYTISGPAWVNNHAHALRPNESKVRIDFLGYHFRHFDFTPYITGTTRPKLTQRDLLRVEVPVPQLAEQERIVKLLDEADELRKLRAQADSRTADLIPALFHEMFGPDAPGSDAWQIATVAELAAAHEGAIRTGPFGSDLRHSEFVEEGIPVLGIDNVVENEFRWTKSRCIPEAKFKEMKRFVVFPGDVLVTIMGTVGRCSVAPEELPVCISTKHLCTVTLDLEKAHPRFIWGAFLHDAFVKQQTRLVGKGAIMEGWNSTIIKRLRLRVPPLPLQKEFAARVSEIGAMQAEQAASRRRLDDLFQSMLHRAFQGEL
jgi:type I restriction enzyme S subunit